MNINLKQGISVVVAVLGVLVISSAQLTDLLGPTVAKAVISLSSLAMSILSGIQVALTSQGATVKDTLAMPGVEPLRINADANKTLAAIAVDPDQPKIAPVAGQERAVNDIANS